MCSFHYGNNYINRMNGFKKCTSDYFCTPPPPPLLGYQSDNKDSLRKKLVNSNSQMRTEEGTNVCLGSEGERSVIKILSTIKSMILTPENWRILWSLNAMNQNFSSSQVLLKKRGVGGGLCQADKRSIEYLHCFYFMKKHKLPTYTITCIAQIYRYMYNIHTYIYIIVYNLYIHIMQTTYSMPDRKVFIIRYIINSCN